MRRLKLMIFWAVYGSIFAVLWQAVDQSIGHKTPIHVIVITAVLVSFLFDVARSRWQ